MTPAKVMPVTAVTVTDAVSEAVAPALSVTVRRAVYVPELL